MHGEVQVTRTLAEVQQLLLCATSKRDPETLMHGTSRGAKVTQRTQGVGARRRRVQGMYIYVAGHCAWQRRVIEQAAGSRGGSERGHSVFVLMMCLLR